MEYAQYQRTHRAHRICKGGISMDFYDYEIRNCEVHYVVTHINSDYSTEVTSDTVIFKGTSFEQCQMYLDTI